MQVVKVKAPGHFAAFCGDNEVRACDLQAMAFSEVELVNLAAYRKELNEYGEVGCSREAFIEDYICQHS